MFVIEGPEISQEATDIKEKNGETAHLSTSFC